MKTKKIISTLLYIFIAVSLVYLVANEMNPKPVVQNEDQVAKGKISEDNLAKPVEKEMDTKPDVQNDEQVAKEKTTEDNLAKSDSHKVIVYYLHGNVRCRKCMLFEEYTDQALKINYKDALDSQKIEWKIINFDEPENEHFIYDYELATKSVVLVEMKNGKQIRWKNLKKIWDLVRDKDSFDEYIRKELDEYLKGI